MTAWEPLRGPNEAQASDRPFAYDSHYLYLSLGSSGAQLGPPRMSGPGGTAGWRRVNKVVGGVGGRVFAINRLMRSDSLCGRGHAAVGFDYVCLGVCKYTLENHGNDGLRWLVDVLDIWCQGVRHSLGAM